MHIALREDINSNNQLIMGFQMERSGSDKIPIFLNGL